MKAVFSPLGVEVYFCARRGLRSTHQIQTLARPKKHTSDLDVSKAYEVNAARGFHGQAQYMWKYAGESLEQVSSYKHLGVWFSENLGWNLHISKLATKGNKTAAELGRVFAMRKLPIKGLDYDGSIGA